MWAEIVFALDWVLTRVALGVSYWTIADLN